MQPKILKFAPKFPEQKNQQTLIEQDVQKIVPYAIVFLFGMLIGLFIGLLPKDHLASANFAWKNLHARASISK